MQNKLILPKPWLSWSQLTCWNSNPTRYRREYFECGKKLDTKYLRFGKGIAGILEELAANITLLEDPVWVKSKLGLDINSDEFLSFKENLVVCDSPEFEIKTDVLGVPILSYIDSYDSVDNVFREYKTGKIPWTLAKVIKHGQLLFYAVALKYSIGEVPEYCHLDWIQTKDKTVENDDFWRQNEKKVQITGKIKSFYRPFHEKEIERMEKLIVKTAKEISEAYISFLKEI